MARVLAVFDDLLLGSNVLGMLRAAGHDAELTTEVDPAGVDLVIVDLAATTFDGVALVEGLDVCTLGVYSHVDVETRRRAQASIWSFRARGSRVKERRWCSPSFRRVTLRKTHEHHPKSGEGAQAGNCPLCGRFGRRHATRR